MNKIRQKIYNLIRDDDVNNIWGNIFDGTIITLILINIATVIMDTFNMPVWYTRLSYFIEVFSVVVFTVEYLLRLITSDLKYTDKKPIIAVVKYIFSFMAIIDLLAILPFYIPFMIEVDLRVLRALRIFRMFRLFKFSRYTDALGIIKSVMRKKKHQLVSSVVVIFILMVISSVLMYNAEHEAQPEVFKNAFSGLWWAIATFTTVGYGDIFPITVLGKVLSAVISLLGIGLVAVPTGIISAGFIESGSENKAEEKKFCPYCGHEYEK